MRPIVDTAARLFLLASLLVPGSAFASSADLFIELTHTNPFAQGETGQTYQIVVRNRGAASSSGTVNVTDTLPSGLTATAIAGTGWLCDLGSRSCSRSTALAAGTSYPVITVTVTVASNAPPEVVNSASVSGGGDSTPANNTATDRTTIWNTTICHDYDFFGGGVPYPVGGVAWQLAVGDFNGDGIPDVVTVNEGDGISVLLGTGGGKLAAATSYFPGSDYSAVEAVDLNGDGVLDLAVLSYHGGSLVTFLGQGNGTFALRESRAIGYGPWRLTARDFNGDGIADLAIARVNSYDLSILIGNGDGSMRNPVAVPAGQGQYDVVSGDFDGDGTLDLAVTSVMTEELLMLRGVGDGSFEDPLSFAAGPEPAYLATGDLNGDGKLDLVVTAFVDPEVSVLLGAGDGTFAPATSYPIWSYLVSAVVIEDANADGKADIVVSRQDIEVLPGNGNGTFQPYEDLAWSNYELRDLAVVDLDRDGAADLVTIHDSSLLVQRAGCIDLTITKSHTGDFRAGQTGATYTLVVKNAGIKTATGRVTVTDSVPAGLTATSMSGQGWTCSSTTSCVRYEDLAPDAEFPPITVNVNVSVTAPATVTNVAQVSGGGDGRPENNSASDVTNIVSGRDLEIVKSHSMAFAAGRIGYLYEIDVTNVGTQSTNAMVTVVDQLPPCLHATSMTGTIAWTCDLPTLTCRTAWVLSPSHSYPTISVIVDTAANCPSLVTNVASVSGGGDSSPANNVSSDPTIILVKPTGLVARPSGTTSATVTWNPVPGATTYYVSRGIGASGLVGLGTTTSTSYLDTTVNPNNVYRYSVRANNGTTFSAFSNPDSVLTMAFTDDPVVAGSTVVKAVHLTELRNAVSLMRSAAGLTSVTYTDPSPAGLNIRPIHLTELRDRLNEARVALGVGPQAYTDSPLAAGTTIKSAHVQELREAIK